MPCTPLGEAVVCSPPRDVVRRRYEHCPVCNHRRRFVQRFNGLYYDATVTCCGCGDSWSGGERAGRPFRRGWRTEAIEWARQAWAAAMTPAEFTRHIRAELQAQDEFTASYQPEEND